MTDGGNWSHRWGVWLMVVTDHRGELHDWWWELITQVRCMTDGGNWSHRWGVWLMMITGHVVVAGMTRDRKVPGSSPRRNGGRMFFSRVSFLSWLLFRYPFHPVLPLQLVKDSCHSAKGTGVRLQLNTHATYVCGFKWRHCKSVHGCMVFTELAPRRQKLHVAPAMQQPNSAVSTPLRWIPKTKQISI